jgi:uncharacterized protein (TIGR03435 family)
MLGLFASALQAQDVAGTWQGTLTRPEGGTARLVAKISRDINGPLNATAYNADRSAPTIPVNAISFQGLTLRMTLPTMNATYEGRLSSDGNLIAGTLTQASAMMPLNLVRATPQTAWTIPDPPMAVGAMGNDVTPGIEVATIKPSRPDARDGGFMVGSSGVLTAINAPLNGLIAMAYGVDQRQLSAAPSWIELANFDITIKPDREGVPNKDQARLLWRALLADRFALKAHIEKKEQSAYALSVLKSGLKMMKVDPPRGDHPFFGLGAANLRVNNATMADLANVLSHVVGRPVVDQTGIGGRYDCLLQFLPSPAERAQLPPNEQPPEDAPPDVYAALERQCGLHLQSTRALADTVIIDKIEKPSEN